MRWILGLLLLFLLVACHKDSSQPCNTGPCNFTLPSCVYASFPDTNLAYQLILGKWYLREEIQNFPEGCGTSTNCYSDSTSFVVFYSNRMQTFGNETVPYGIMLDTFRPWGDPNQNPEYGFALGNPYCDTTGAYYTCDVLNICDSVLKLGTLSEFPYEATYLRTWK